MFKENIYYKVSTILIATFLSLNVFAQNWDVPADKKAKNSYLKFDDATSKEGEVIYTKNCVSCHGNPGKGNSLKTLNPIPPDMLSTQTQALTDGELFYILVAGRMIMPSFKNILSENERWKVISYIRGFNKKYVQVLSKTDPNKSELVRISTSFDNKTNKIKVEVKANEPKGVVFLKDAEIMLFAKRNFGRLQIDNTLRTNNEGVATFNFPKDLPGDKAGNVEIFVKVNDDIYGEIESQSNLKIGIPTDKPGLNEKRAIWNVMAKAPIWLLITYTFCMLLVISCFIYIFYNLYRIQKSGIN
ncbi:MAG: cytochrome c [Paludibacter sp.]|nr:cytochrome c [Paludibacter sp.]